MHGLEFVHMLSWTFYVYLCLEISFMVMKLLFSDIKEMKGADVSFYLTTFLDFKLGLTGNANK